MAQVAREDGRVHVPPFFNYLPMIRESLRNSVTTSSSLIFGTETESVKYCLELSI